MEIIIDVQEHEPGVSEEIKVKGELVRCKDCRYMEKYGNSDQLGRGFCKEFRCDRSYDWYCANGKRRDA